jgi:hypothetical protein
MRYRAARKDTKLPTIIPTSEKIECQAKLSDPT